MKINRHIVAIVVCAIVLFVGGVYANKAWNSEVVQVQAKAYVAKKAADYKETQRQQAEDREKAKIKADCTAQVDFYNKLTAVQKKTTPAPTCQNLEILE